MIAAWMSYCILAAIFFWCCGVWAEVALRRWRLPGRFVWLGVLALTVLTFLGIPRFGGVEVDAGEPLHPIALGATALVERIAPAVNLEAFGRLDRVLLGVWLLASCIALLRLWLSKRVIARSSRQWSRAWIEGFPVWVSEDVGPAVLGIGEREVVLPRWALDLEMDSRRLLLRHEREHMWTADPAVRLLSLLAAAIFPWNPGIWLQARSLREAIEIDCDQRVVRRSGENGRYAGLLFEVARRRSAGAAPSPGLPMARPPIERRLRILRGRDGGLEPRRVATTLALAVLFPLVALVLPPPPFAAIGRAAGGLLDRSTLLEEAPAGAAFDAAQWLDEREATMILGRAYPPALASAGVAGTVVVAAYVGPTGRVLAARVVEESGSHDLDTAALRAVRDFRFSPARVGGRVTASWVQYPLSFSPPDREAVQVLAVPPAAAPGAARVAIWNSAVPAARR